MTDGRVTLTGRPARFPGGLREVASGTFAWIQPNGAWGEANAGLVIGRDASLLIDTLWDESLARGMLAAMAPQLDGAPIRTVLNTHQDGDHWWGNGEKQWPTPPATCRSRSTASSPGRIRAANTRSGSGAASFIPGT